MKSALIGLVLFCASIASAAQNPQMPPEKVVAKILVTRWVETPVAYPEGEYLTMALDETGTKGYWAACSPPTGYTDLALPINVTPLMVAEVMPTPSGMWAKRPGTKDKIVAYHLYSFFECVVNRATSLGTSSGPKTIVIKAHTPLLGMFGVNEFEVVP